MSCTITHRGQVAIFSLSSGSDRHCCDHETWPPEQFSRELEAGRTSFVVDTLEMDIANDKERFLDSVARICKRGLRGGAEVKFVMTAEQHELFCRSHPDGIPTVFGSVDQAVEVLQKS